MQRILTALAVLGNVCMLVLLVFIVQDEGIPDWDWDDPYILVFLAWVLVPLLSIVALALCWRIRITLPRVDTSESLIGLWVRYSKVRLRQRIAEIESSEGTRQ